MTDPHGWPGPSPEMLADPLFNAVWQVIKTWDLYVPHVYVSYCGTTGNHVRAVVEGIQQEVAAREQAAAQAMRSLIVGWISEVRDYCLSQRDAAQTKMAEDLFDALARAHTGILDGIARMPLPTDTLDAMQAAAELRGRRDGSALRLNPSVRPEPPLEALPPPSGRGALAAMLAQAKREGMEEAARVALAWRDGNPDAVARCDWTGQYIAGAIRAAAKEIKP